MVGLINAILYITSGAGLLLEYFGIINFGLVALLTPGFLGILSSVLNVTYQKRLEAKKDK